FLLVACRDSRMIQVFQRDPVTGLLHDTHQDITVDKPVCIQFVE
ncbi:beta-propeller fold lactonase family protein, partial [uncultured Bacteroides sp.]